MERHKSDDIVEDSILPIDFGLDSIIENFTDLEVVIYPENGLIPITYHVTELHPDLHAEVLDDLSNMIANRLNKLDVDLDLDAVELFSEISSFLFNINIDNLDRPEDYEKSKKDEIVMILGISHEELDDAINQYEKKSSREARFVRGMEEILVLLTHIENHGRQIRKMNYLEAGVRGKLFDGQKVEMGKYLVDLPQVLQLREQLLNRLVDDSFPKELTSN